MNIDYRAYCYRTLVSPLLLLPPPPAACRLLSPFSICHFCEIAVSFAKDVDKIAQRRNACQIARFSSEKCEFSYRVLYVFTDIKTKPPPFEHIKPRSPHADCPTGVYNVQTDRHEPVRMDRLFCQMK